MKPNKINPLSIPETKINNEIPSFSAELFGSKKIPEITKGLGKMMREVKDASNEIKREIKDSTKDIKDNIDKEING